MPYPGTPSPIHNITSITLPQTGAFHTPFNAWRRQRPIASSSPSSSRCGANALCTTALVGITSGHNLTQFNFARAIRTLDQKTITIRSHTIVPVSIAVRPRAMHNDALNVRRKLNCVADWKDRARAITHKHTCMCIGVLVWFGGGCVCDSPRDCQGVAESRREKKLAEVYITEYCGGAKSKHAQRNTENAIYTQSESRRTTTVDTRGVAAKLCCRRQYAMFEYSRLRGAEPRYHARNTRCMCCALSHPDKRVNKTHSLIFCTYAYTYIYIYIYANEKTLYARWCTMSRARVSAHATQTHSHIHMCRDFKTGHWTWDMTGKMDVSARRVPMLLVLLAVSYWVLCCCRRWLGLLPGLYIYMFDNETRW